MRGCREIYRSPGRVLLALVLLGFWARPASAAEATEAAGGPETVTPATPAAADRASGLAWDFWFPRDELNPSERARLPAYCAGGYRWPQFPYPAGSRNEDYPIDAEARHAQYWESGEVVLEGEVVVHQGNRTLRAPAADLNHETRLGSARDLQVEEPQVILRAHDARINFDTKAGSFEDVQFLLPDAEFRGQAARMNRDEAGDLEVVSGRFTRCEPTSNNWRIGSRKFTIEHGSDFGSARHAVVRVKDVPVFYSPYLRFPVNDERQSGWLFPDIGWSSQNGFEFGPPYYLNLAPNYDATIVPRYIQKRGVGIEAEFRHLSSWEETRLAGAYLGEDKLYDGTYEKNDFDRLEEAGQVQGPFQPANRWLYAMVHKGEAGNWLTTVNYTAVSDRDYFRNLGTVLDVSNRRRELERSGSVEYLNGGFLGRLWAQRFDRLDNVRVDAYQRLPELDLSYDAYVAGLDWSLAGSAVAFDRDNEQLTGIDRINGQRLHVAPKVRLPLSRSWGYLTVTGGYRYTSYNLEDTAPEVDDQPQRGIGLGSVDSGLFFDRDTRLFGAEIVQTLEPRLFYLYQQFEDQDQLPRFDASQLTFRYDQLWRDNRFSGIDRIGDANQLSVGLTSRFLNPASGREYFRVSLGQIRYFEDRRVTLTGTQNERDLATKSELAGDMVATAGRWTLGGTLVWDPAESAVNDGGGYLRYRSDNDHLFHLGYRYLRASRINQADVGLKWPVTRRYGLIGRWNFDLESNRTIEGLAGIEYNDCCWQIRLIARRYLDAPSASVLADADTQQGYYLQVVFKGLAGIGNSVESMLSNSLPGYFEED